jgi:hypothetical protein
MFRHRVRSAVAPSRSQPTRPVVVASRFTTHHITVVLTLRPLPPTNSGHQCSSLLVRGVGPRTCRLYVLGISIIAKKPCFFYFPDKMRKSRNLLLLVAGLSCLYASVASEDSTFEVSIVRGFPSQHLPLFNLRRAIYKFMFGGTNIVGVRVFVFVPRLIQIAILDMRVTSFSFLFVNPLHLSTVDGVSDSIWRQFHRVV